MNWTGPWVYCVYFIFLPSFISLPEEHTTCSESFFADIMSRFSTGTCHTMTAVCSLIAMRTLLKINAIMDWYNEFEIKYQGVTKRDSYGNATVWMHIKAFQSRAFYTSTPAPWTELNWTELNRSVHKRKPWTLRDLKRFCIEECQVPPSAFTEE